MTVPIKDLKAVYNTPPGHCFGPLKFFIASFKFSRYFAAYHKKYINFFCIHYRLTVKCLRTLGKGI